MRAEKLQKLKELVAAQYDDKEALTINFLISIGIELEESYKILSGLTSKKDAEKLKTHLMNIASQLPNQFRDALMMVEFLLKHKQGKEPTVELKTAGHSYFGSVMTLFM